VWTDENDATDARNAAMVKMLYVTYPVQRPADEIVDVPDTAPAKTNGRGHKVKS
jgi:hypothetical protein